MLTATAIVTAMSLLAVGQRAVGHAVRRDALPGDAVRARVNLARQRPAAQCRPARRTVALGHAAVDKAEGEAERAKVGLAEAINNLMCELGRGTVKWLWRSTRKREAIKKETHRR
jgi:hypothetical protein